MRKTIITLCAFVMLFSFAVSGAMAQTWSGPQKITNTEVPFYDFVVFPDSEVLNGCDDADPPTCSVVMTTTAQTGTLGSPVNNFNEQEKEDSVIAPPAGIKYGVFGTTVGMWVEGPGGGSGEYVRLAVQPNVPVDAENKAFAGSFTHIAAGSNGTLYVIFTTEPADPDPVEQYLLVGESNWEEVTVRFTPRALNTGSNGRWVTCKISDFPDQYTPANVDLETVCIVAINGIFLSETDNGPICSKDSGGPSNNRNKNKLMVKFDRYRLASFIYVNQNTEDPETAVITVAGYSTDGSLQFYGVDDTIKIIPKEPKGPKKPK